MSCFIRTSLSILFADPTAAPRVFEKLFSSMSQGVRLRGLAAGRLGEGCVILTSLEHRREAQRALAPIELPALRIELFCENPDSVLECLEKIRSALEGEVYTSSII
ncbi:MAG: hypothetical protein QXU97_05350 [Fervidicoccaceae archaeon]